MLSGFNFEARLWCHSIFFDYVRRSGELGLRSLVVGLIRNQPGEVPLMSLLKASLVCTVLGAGMLALSGVNASAAIACTGNVCWHVHEHYDYPPSARVITHDDDWRAGPGITFHEHEGRGYWNGDRWSDW